MSELSVAILSLAACVFASSAAAKLRSRQAYQSFRAGLGETALMPERMLPTAVAALPGAEAVTAAGLAVAAGLAAAAGPGAKPAAETALTAAAVLTAVLAGGVALVMRRGTEARCACFGAGSGRPLGGVHLIRNLTLLALLVSGAAGSALGHGHPAPAGIVVAAAAGAVAALLFVRWEDLAGLFTPISSPAAARAVRRPGHGPR